ncbi:hypothetical protein [Oceanithermus sp.]|uniref:hypothetical protein n=1 Tax=Oceanithermus sp. TaxID=2268145 RepID=UPI0025EDC544|nr:hypothetical protein [Oceanithermus sp.]
MTRTLRAACVGLLLTAGSWTQAQVWYYNVDQDIQIQPATIEFDPSALDLLCAALLNEDAPVPGGVQVSNLPVPSGCPATPPVVVYGVDPDTGDAVYALRVVVKFWGRYRANDPTYGTDALTDLIKRDYALQMQADGDLDAVLDEFAPPFTTPPVDAPVTAAAWYGWDADQTISLADPEVSDVQNHPWWNSTCYDLYQDRCWSAIYTWALPVRLRLRGDEFGSYNLTVTPGLFEPKTASTLWVHGGNLVRPRLLPGPR